MASKFKPLVLYATDFYKLSSLLVKRVLLSKPVGNLGAYKEKTKQLLLDQSRPSVSPNVAAVKLLHLDREFGLLQYYGVQEYARRWMKSRPSTSSPTPQSITQTTEQAGGTSNNSNNNNNVARVAFMITSEQRRKLSADLGYTQQDIRSFKPIEALLLIENDVKKTSPSDGDAQYNFRDRLKELVEENEELMAKQASPSSSSVTTENKKETLIEKPQSISPEDAEHAHVKADVAMALLSAEKGDDPKVEGVSIAKEQQTPEDVSNDEKEVTSAITLIDEDDADKQGIRDDISTKTEKSNIDAAPTPALPLSVKVTPNDSTELHMKPDIAAAFIGSHLQKEEFTIGVSDVSDTDKEEEDGPGWYEVVMGSMDAKEKGEQEDEVVALFATKKEALECVDIKKRLASG
eukprot:CAMPEP_0201690558 /NCGR_PEP_ID=MMETSP0578-20130828/3982_1 /ASSEMBLY_ACC=CAM_ASM_000663 /TAXON_ID=267565 /ORGANISM="Skeletonema grethea, Strain CCMP 1804" /LENGTH=404 /DNA_ID=CAMNT_0048175585 /DNA_START=212 /DNA_END=1422 /DNA_ORIENTATION=-